MATDTAAPPAPRRAGTRPEAPRRLWQVPVFLLGVAVFLAAYTGWLRLPAPDPDAAFRRDLADLRAAAGKLAPDAAQLRASLNRVAAASVGFPALEPDAHFALGTGYVRLAELSGDPAEARNDWVLARQHFEAARPDQLADPANQARFAYRAAKARAADLPHDMTPADIDAVRKQLQMPPAHEDPGDGNRLIADLSLRLTPPDLGKAKEALTAYVAEAGITTPPASVARAKLRLSQINLDLRDQNEAKMWLSKIGPDAPADVLPVAKAQLARIRMAEHDWAGAAGEWEQVRANAGLAPAMQAAAAYHLGVCRLNTRPADEAAAARLFADAVKADGPEATAARVRLADLDLRSDDKARHKNAAGLLETAVSGVDAPAGYANTLVPLNELQASFESAIQVLAADGAFDAAVAVADKYAAVATAGRDQEKRAEVLAAWGAALQKDKGDAAPKFTAAAEAFTALADTRPADTDKAEQLRRAAKFYREANNPAAAVSTLERVIKLPKLPDDVAGPVWLDYAEGLLAANRPDAALPVFQKAMTTSGPSSTAARYRVARLLIDSRAPGSVELGVGLMDQIAQAERVTAAEQDMHERALVEAGYQYINKGKFAEAEARLSKQLKLYPTGAEAGLGQLLLATCLLQQADPKARPPATNPTKNLEEAIKLCRQVVADVEERKKAGRAADRDPFLRTQARIRVLSASLLLGRTSDVLVDGDKLRREEEVAGTVDELIVMSMMYAAYPRSSEGALTVYGQMRDVFEKLKLKPGAFSAKSSDYSREFWEKWFPPDAAPAPPMK